MEYIGIVVIRIELPVRACWWLKHLAVKENCSAERLLERWTLERLNATPGVDLSRSPVQGE